MTFSQVGRPVRRKEDARLVRGRGRYVGDLRLPGMAEAAILRSDLAHGEIVGLDTAAALELPGVVAVLTWGDLKDVLPFADPADKKIASALGGRVDLRVAPYRADVLAREKVLRVGEPVAIVVAVDRYVAEDALELIQVDYEPLPTVSDPLAAMEEGSPRLHADVPGNVCAEFRLTVGDPDRAFAGADHRVSERFAVGRSIGVPLETRGVVASFDDLTGELTIWAANQRPHLLRTYLSSMLGLTEERIRVISPDMGGSFGGSISAEEIAICAAALRLRRPLRWVEDRREHLLTARHSRDQVHDVEVAFDREGRILAVADQVVVDVGSHGTFGLLLPYNTVAHLRGQLRIEHLRAHGMSVLTNKTPNTPVRGAGRPEAVFVMDRIVDMVAAHVGRDPAEVRMLNLIPAAGMPYRTGMLYQDGVELVYDSGDYPGQLRTALEAVDYQGFRREQERLKSTGRRVGIGISSHVEGSGLGPHEGAIVRVDATGHVVVHTGANPHGQSHETTLGQVCADALGVAVEAVSVRTGDTALIPHGAGTFASRTAVAAGSAVHLAATRLREKILLIAADLLEASPADLSIEDGRISVAGVPDVGLDFADVFRAAAPGSGRAVPEGLEPGLEAQSYFVPPTVTVSSGTHVAVVEVDEETGQVDVLRYVAVDDCGRMLNPTVVDGQQHGGVAHGIGNVLYEHAVYDEDGQLLTASFMDYLLPTAMEVPAVEVVHETHLSPLNPLGVKGTGEGATGSAVAAVSNAVADALRPLPVRLTQVPLSPAALRALIEEAAAHDGGGRGGRDPAPGRP